jgi:hypothetical protein
MNSPIQAENTNNYIEYFPKHRLKVKQEDCSLNVGTEIYSDRQLGARFHRKLAIIMDLQQ